MMRLTLPVISNSLSTTICSAFLTVGTLAISPAAHAGPATAVVVQSGPVQVQYVQAPPPPRYEVVPAPRRGMVWVPGHWEWRGHRHVWMSGYWTKMRPGYHYRPAQWHEREGRWYMQPGGWDRDGDGVPNRYDRDRDGDGVPNRYDRRPDNPRRP